jgi:hypothetical protein
MDTAEVLKEVWNWATAGAMAGFVAKSARDKQWKQKDELRS